jgi:hypothetical protein
MGIDVIFISKVGCGICELMKPAWMYIKDSHLDWNYYHYVIGVDTEAHDVVADWSSFNRDLPWFCVYKDNKPIDMISGGHRYKDIIKMLEKIVIGK